MVSDGAKAELAKALATFRSGEPGLWPAVPALARLAREAEVTIDFSTEAALGAPLIIARPLPKRAVAGLTPRQAEIAGCIADGQSNKTIARRLGISPGTVKDHVHAILKASGCRSRAEVMALLHGANPNGPRGPAPSIQGWRAQPRPPVTSKS